MGYTQPPRILASELAKQETQPVPQHGTPKGPAIPPVAGNNIPARKVVISSNETPAITAGQIAIPPEGTKPAVPQFGDTRMYDPVAEAEALRRQVMGMTEEQKQQHIAKVRQHILDFNAKRREDECPIADVRLGVAIAQSTYIPVLPEAAKPAKEPKEVKQGTPSRSVRTPKPKVNTADILKSVFAGLPPLPPATKE